MSPVSVSDGSKGWFGIGPISVALKNQKNGIGTKLMGVAIAELKQLGASGCVLLGDPQFYSRFGFKVIPTLVMPGVPSEYFQALPFISDIPNGEVTYHDAFNAQS